MRRVGEDERLHGVVLDSVPSDSCGKTDAGGLSILDEESTYHGEVGIGANTCLITCHRALASETSACFADAVGILASLVVINQICAEACEHLQEVGHHLLLFNELACDDSLSWGLHVLFVGFLRFDVLVRNLD